MKFARHFSFLAAMLVASGLLIAGEAVWFGQRWLAAKTSTRLLQERRRELTTLESFAPAPNAPTAAAIEAELAATREHLAAMCEELGGRSPNAARTVEAPTTRAEAYFDIVSFVDRSRERAKIHGVALAADAVHFGFATYSNGGPDDAHRAAVFQQRLAIEELLEALFAAHPQTLVAIKREAPAVGGIPGASASEQGRELPSARHGAANAPAPDFFTLDPRLTLRVRDQVATMAFQLSFTGQTASLRIFLNRLATHAAPVMVREVHVEPVTPDAVSHRPRSPMGVRANVVSYLLTEDTPPAAAEDEALPVIVRPYSKFVVTVECVKLAPMGTAMAVLNRLQPAE